MATKLSDITPAELSLVFKTFGGKSWGPRNEEARVLGVKAGEKDKKSLAAKAIETLKAYFYDDTSYPVSTDVADGVDNDGDGAEDYNSIYYALCNVAYDLNQACCIGEDEPRALAIKATIDKFLAELDKFRSGEQAEGAMKTAPEAAGATAETPAAEEVSRNSADAPASGAAAELAASVAAEVTKARGEIESSLKASFDEAVANVRKSAEQEVEAAKSAAESAKSATEAAKTQIASLENTVKAMTEKAREPAAAGGTSVIDGAGERTGPLGESTKELSVKGMTVVEATKAIFASKR